jgi:hypothetical protein
MRVLIVKQVCDGGHYLNCVRHLVQAFAPSRCSLPFKPGFERQAEDLSHSI